jgi:UDP-N-acetylmuramoyl-tripeptide--D-alanyl-D-alanine ligase
MLGGALRALVRIREAWRERRLRRALRYRWVRLESVLWRRSRLAHLYRRLLPERVTVIGVTGSCGKTTTTQLVAAVLATRHTGRTTPGHYKMSPFVERALVSTRPSDDFCVVEMTIENRGRLVFDETLALIRPRIGIVTVIRSDHLGIFRSPRAAAAQKGRLVECLPEDGVAVLNADDPLVREMAERTRARVLTYGLAEDAMLRARDVRARWPERLSFTVHHAGRAALVRTQLCGAHLLPNVLAALAAGVAMGVPLEEAARAVEAVPPFEQRLCPLAHPDGFTIVRDDYKAPLWSIPAALEFLRDASASRKAIVLGTISDYSGPSDRTYLSVARQALDVADLVVFVGNHSAKALKAQRGDALQAFYSADAAAEHLHAWLRPGDLVLLKGSPIDELERIVTGSKRTHRLEGLGRFQVVAGLGNPRAALRDTPHNVGHRVLDRVASALGAAWSDEPDAQVARADGVLLVKPAAWMNTSGRTLAAVAERLGFGAADLILVHDDLDIPIGSVRVRHRSGDGGHRGVRSVLRAFHTDEIRRVRVGVGRPERGVSIETFVVAPFDDARLAALDEACAEAADRALALLGRSERVRADRARAG